MIGHAAGRIGFAARFVRADPGPLDVFGVGEDRGNAVRSIAESYGGVAQFSDDDNRFFSNIAIPLNRDAQQVEA